MALESAFEEKTVECSKLSASLLKAEKISKKLTRCRQLIVVFSSFFFRTQKLLFLHYKLLLTSLQTRYKTLLTILLITNFY